MEHARYRVKNNGGHGDKWFHMSRTHRVFNLPLFHHEGFESEIVGKSR